ncbi:MAG: Hsp20/alpha crystallin family protein, partial [Phototrophicales bacterium]
MSLIPRSSVFDIEKAFDRLFDPSPLNTMTNGIAAPRVDIKEKDDQFEITAELPGIKKEDVHVQLHNGVLSIEAETNDEKTEEKDGKVIRKERY